MIALAGPAINIILSFIGLNKFSNCLFNSFIIGNISYLIFEFPNDKSIIINQLISKLLINNIEYYWFRSYDEFEDFIDILAPNNKGYLIVLIG